MRKRLALGLGLALLIAVGCMTTKAEGQALETRPQPTILNQCEDDGLCHVAKPIETSPIAYLYWKAGSEEAPLLERIVTCESGWNPLAKNANSTASGLGQFLTSTWISTRTKMGLDTNPELKLDWKQNLDTMIFLYNTNGTQPWLSSANCWKSYDSRH